MNTLSHYILHLIIYQQSWSGIYSATDLAWKLLIGLFHSFFTQHHWSTIFTRSLFSYWANSKVNDRIILLSSTSYHESTIFIRNLLNHWVHAPMNDRITILYSILYEIRRIVKTNPFAASDFTWESVVHPITILYIVLYMNNNYQKFIQLLNGFQSERLQYFIISHMPLHMKNY